MTIQEYQKYVKEGASKDYTKELAIIGVMGELGELSDVVKKEAIFKDMSKFIEKYGMSVEDKMTSEIGDIMWQVFNLANMYNIDMEKILEHNVEKLNKRHGGAGKTAIDGGIRLNPNE